MKGILGVVNFEADKVKIEGLSDYRPIPAMSFLGRYRFIDFILSNMVNSGIDKIRVLAKDKPRSLIEHLGAGGQYDLNSKTRSLLTLYSDHQIGNSLYFTDIAIINQNMQQLLEAQEEYVVIAPSYMLCTIDYSEVVKQHIETGAEITVVYKEIDDGTTNFLGCDEFEFVEGTERVDVIKTSHGSVDNKFISLETYVMSKDRFAKLVEDANGLSAMYTLRDYLAVNTKYFNILGYHYTGYLRCVNSFKQYYDVNMELLDHVVFKELFNKNWPIFTKTNDSAPSFYAASAKVKNCIVANGCAIQGDVENCIIGRGVKIKRGAKVRNSIILAGAIIGADATIDYAVIDKHAKISLVKEIVGNEDNLLYVRRRDNV